MQSEVNQTHEPIRVGVSSCLLGEQVRFDGGHKRDSFVTDELAQFVELVRYCPEVDAGMPTPRPAIRLQLATEDSDGPVRVVESIDPRSDHTTALERAAKKRVRSLDQQQLCG